MTDDREEQRRLASMTDNELREFRRALFGEPEPRLPLGRTRPANANTVPAEGANPGTDITDESRWRDLSRRLFDPDYAAYQQPLPEPE